jgi:hypothetical protein
MCSGRKYFFGQGLENFGKALSWGWLTRLGLRLKSDALNGKA